MGIDPPFTHGLRGGPTHYDVLGVSPGASAKEIRAAFLEAAKRAHPDVSGESDGFRRLLEAYEVLKNTDTREEYDRTTQGFHAEGAGASWPHPKAEQWRGGGGAGPRKGPENPWAGTDEDKEADAEVERVVMQWLRGLSRGPVGGDGGVVVVGARQELSGALKRAYLGPRVETSAGLPKYFEADVRGARDLVNVLEIVSGRQRLGCVREAMVKKLGTGPSAASPTPLPAPATAGAEEQGEQTGESGRARQPKIASPRALELVYGGVVEARATRRVRRREGGTPLDVIKITRAGGEEEVMAYIYGLDGRAGEARSLAELPMFQMCEVAGATGRPSHTLLLHKTPGVQNMTFVRAPKGGSKPWRGAGAWHGVDSSPLRRNVGRLECRVSKAWLPPSQLWVFSPRETAYEHSWYFERTDGAGKGASRWTNEQLLPRGPSQGYRAPEGALDPSIYVLAAAFRTLDEERARVLGEGRERGISGGLARRWAAAAWGGASKGGRAGGLWGVVGSVAAGLALSLEVAQRASGGL